MDRRDLLKGTLALAATQLPWPARAAAGASEPFGFAWLKGRARFLSQAAYRAPTRDLPKPLAQLDWDQFQAIHDRPERALWADAGLDFQVQFFHLGAMYREPVRVHEVAQGRSRPVLYDSAMFDFGRSGVQPRALPKNLGFAGVRVRYHTDWRSDLVSFLGASYFRAVGASRQFGLSARGLAIGAGSAQGEEFPIFTEFWLERPAPRSGRLTLYALLESASISGAYRIDILPGADLVMEIDAALYPRKPVERLGLAPLTSMYLCGENDRRVGNDWRPEIHDSDGLALWTGKQEWIWRPLVNSPAMRLNSFVDDNPRGYGLLQRDREFDHYQDDAVYYERRPSAWVEPRGEGWGKGAVQLLEMPAPDETVDNVVAFWHPAAPVAPGQELLCSYRLHWSEQVPMAPALAQVAATRTGIGGVVGRKRDHFSWRFAVDFAGGPIGTLGRDVDVRPVISASRGAIEIASARPLRDPRSYRAMFDLRPTDDSVEPIDLRLYLTLAGQPLTETWLYQWTPPPPAERRF
jgi:glucans biosynthesis protein